MARIMASCPRWILPTALAAAVVAVFAPSLWCGFVNWDDSKLIEANPHFRGLSASHLGWMATTREAGHYQPLTWLSLGIDYTIWGMRPAGYHLTNVLLHAGGAALAYLLLLRLLAAGGADASQRRTQIAALAGAALWALHPLRVESVAWVTERRDVLAGVFYFPALLCYLRLQRESGVARRKWLAASLGFMALSGLCKAWVLTLPAVLLVIDTYPLRRWAREEASRVLVEKAPFAAIALAVAIMAFSAQRSTGGMPTVARYTVAQRVAVAGYGLAFYPLKTVAPARLSPLYAADHDADPLSRRFVLAWLAVLAAGGACVALRTAWPGLAAGAAAYAIVVSPVLGLVQVGPQEVADRYSYLSCLAWSAVLASAVAVLPGWRLSVGVLALASAGWIGLTVAQIGAWRDSFTLWGHAVRVNPSNYDARCNHAQSVGRAGDWARALREFEAAMPLRPRSGVAHAGRGNARIELGDPQGAIADFSEAICRGPAHVRPGAHLLRGVAYMRIGAVREALADFDESIRLDGSDPMAYSNRGTARASIGELPKGIEDFDRGLELDPLSFELWTKRGYARAKLGEARVAMADFDRALRLNPNYPEALMLRAGLWESAGRHDLARRDYERALQNAPATWPSRDAVRARLAEIP